MKSFILITSAMAAFVGMTSCEKHDWEDENGKGVVELYRSDDASKEGDHGHAEHKQQNEQDDKAH